MKQKKKTKIIVIILIFLVLIAVGGFYTYRYLNNKKLNKDANTIEVLDKIKNYDYQLEDRDTEIYKENFLKLKDILEKQETIDYQAYANYLATLFLIDLYTIENKISKYDVGSLDFIYPKEKEKFQNKVMDTIYKLVKDNSSNTRNQELPVVEKVEIIKTEESDYKKGETILKGYLIKANIFYKKDLGYDKKVSLTIVKEENKLYVVNLTTEEI